ncbi:hypothetical protein ACFOW1_06415 [Parasediminibacterium paludis]|uniref:Uncharacterized protein n=1 Tax=Parasediminibacterium paludis TaxID=908966 RepID=A0ABV8PUD2_9BACT
MHIIILNLLNIFKAKRELVLNVQKRVNDSLGKSDTQKRLTICLILLSIISVSNAQKSSIYQLAFGTINQQTMTMADAAGKKIVVAVIDAGSPDVKELLALDTLYKKNVANISVILVPVSDFTPNSNETRLKKLLIDSLALTYPITHISKGKKSANTAQHPLLAWLTNKSINSHFDIDIDKVGGVFIISEKGKLFANLPERIPINGKMMQTILSKQVDDK